VDDEVSCDYHFTYSVDEDQQTILKIQDIRCPPINEAGLYLGLTFLVTMILGLAMIMAYKIKITVDDRRAFAAFEEEQRNRTKYEMESPLYKSPITKFSMPEIDETQFN
jgi:protocadherin alpha